MSVKSFREYTNDWLSNECDYPYTMNESNTWLDGLIESAINDDNGHFGNCVGECNACMMCTLTDLLNDYNNYLDVNHQYRKRKRK